MVLMYYDCMPHSFVEKQRLSKKMIENPTLAERALYSALMQAHIHFYRQYVTEGYILDAYLPDTGIAIECDGGYHTTIEQQFYDIERDTVLKKHGIEVFRFSNEDVLRCPMSIVSRLRKLKLIKRMHKIHRFKKNKCQPKKVEKLSEKSDELKLRLETINKLPSSVFMKGDFKKGLWCTGGKT